MLQGLHVRNMLVSSAIRGGGAQHDRGQSSSATRCGGLASSVIRDRGGGHNVAALTTWRRSQHDSGNFYHL